MPIGTGATTLEHLPSEPYVMDPGLFMQMTTKRDKTPNVVAAPGPGSFVPVRVPQAGIISKVRIIFSGTVVVAGGAATTSDEWPYALLDDYKLSINGQNDLFALDGCDLVALRFVRYPAYAERVDVFPGTVGGGNSIANGTYNLFLTWEVPIAMDDTTLIGSLFAQSSATTISHRIAQALNARLFSAIPGTVAITGNFFIFNTMFDIPFDNQGQMVLPDLTRLHGVNALNIPFANTGDVATPLVRSAGQLERLFVSVRAAAGNRLTTAPNAATSKLIDRIRLEYGGSQVPLDYNPAWILSSINNQLYGATPPYDRIVFDFVRENPARDALFLQGVTELKVTPTVDAGVTVSGGFVRIVQETLF